MLSSKLIQMIRDLNEIGSNFKPHKLLTVLTVIQLAKENKVIDKKVYYDEDFRNKFTRLFLEYADEKDRNRPYNPFFHLRTSGFWNLVPVKGYEKLLNSISSIGGPGDLKRFVAYAELSSELYDVIKDEPLRNKLKEEIVRCLINGKKSRNNKILNKVFLDNTSLFEHENNAINEIQQRMETRGLGHVLHNLYIHDSQTNSYLEIDIVAICHYGVYVIELKHWTGHIQIKPNNWLVNNSFARKDPHILNSTKAKLLRGILERRIPQIADTYVESVVVLTNMDATVDGASFSTSTYTIHNPTFHGIDRFIDYLQFQKDNKKKVIGEIQAKAITDYLLSLNKQERPKSLQFSGYEIIEYLYQYTDRVEVIARRTDIRHQQLSRLRVFFMPHNLSPAEKKCYHERATATLNAVAKVGDHPNILKFGQYPMMMVTSLKEVTGLRREH